MTRLQKKGCAQRASPRPWYARFALPMAFERAVPLGLLSLQRNIRAFDRAHAHRRIRHLVFINTMSRSVSYEREYEDDGELQGWWWVEVA